MDLAEQFAAVWARRAIVLVVAFLAGAGIYTWRSAAPDVYESSSTIQVRVPDTESSDPSTQVDYYAQTVTGLATTRSVVAAAMEAADRTEPVSDVVDGVSAEPSQQPGFVTITASGDTAVEAAELTDALVEAVSEQVAEDQAADAAAERDALVAAIAQVGREREALPDSDFAGRAALVRERESLLSTLRASSGRTAWQVGVVEPARPPSAPASPQPLRDGVLAFLLAAILVAEWIVVRRAWRGAIATRRPARDVERTLGLPAVEIGDDDPPSALAALLPHLESARRIVVVQRGPRPSAHSATLLAELLAGRGREVLLVDASPDRAAVHLETGVRLEPGLTALPADDDAMVTALEGLPTARRLHVLSAGSDRDAEVAEPLRRIDRVAPEGVAGVVVVAASADRLDDLIGVVGEVAGPVVVDLDPRHTTRSELESEVAALRGLGAEVVAATVHVGDLSDVQHLAERRRRGVVFPSSSGSAHDLDEGTDGSADASADGAPGERTGASSRPTRPAQPGQGR